VTTDQFEVREEVLNVLLAELLEEHGLWSVPESIRRRVHGDRRLPDVTLADMWGARIIIEGRILNNEGDRDSLLQDARRRVEEGLSPICLAVLYPPALRTGRTMPELKQALDASSLEVRVISEGDDGGWATSDVDGLVEIVRRGYELLVREDVVSLAVRDLELAIDSASDVISAGRGTTERLADLLGIPEDTIVATGTTDGKPED